MVGHISAELLGLFADLSSNPASLVFFRQIVTPPPTSFGFLISKVGRIIPREFQKSILEHTTLGVLVGSIMMDFIKDVYGSFRAQGRQRALGLGGRLRVWGAGETCIGQRAY